MNDRPAKPPNLNHVDWIEKKHDEAMEMFLEIYSAMRANLIAKNRPVDNAAVRRKDWREYMQWQFHIGWEIAEQIEQSLSRAGKIKLFGGYAVPVMDQEEGNEA
ncbi:hypothetical protein [Acinetobacter venetianus]|uniref:hypothetical protein n=1 Tax=Acinetobacter venetianus TaxID=52133 RepID=UPI003A95364C